MDKRKHDIERYLRGEMTPMEMHALEKEALRDPFLSDALEGIDQAGHEGFLFDLRELHHSVYQRTRVRRQKIISMWNWSLGIAAGLIFIAISSVFIISSLLEEKKDTVAFADEQAKELKPEESSVPPDSVAASTPLATDSHSSPLPAVRQPSAPPTTEPADEPAIALSDDTGEMVPDAAIAETTRDQVVAGSVAADRVARAPAVPADSMRLLAGRVMSAEDNAALPGVNVRVEGTALATVTDAGGFYRLRVPSRGSVVEFSFIGMEKVEVQPGDEKTIDVRLSPDLSQLGEVVVIGYDVAADSSGKVAEPRGGKDAFTEYMAKELRYPEQALKNEVEGRVTIEFTVGADGHLHEFQVLKGLGYGWDDEAIRLVREGPAWTPARKDTQPVAKKVKMRLKFAIPKKQ